MDQYRYKLEEYKGPASRFKCPACGQKSLVRYIDTVTGQHVHRTVGRCNHEDHCCYHLTPKQYFNDNNITPDRTVPKVEFTPTVKPPSLIPAEYLTQSMRSERPNYLVGYLRSLLGRELTQRVVNRYLIGTAAHWTGATVFWQITPRGGIRAGKLMLYDPATGKRKRDVNPTWVHYILKMQDYNLKQTLFGAHLLSDTTRDIALVESEKTAAIASIYLPQLLWLATGNKGGFTADRCKDLAGRKVYVYPDLGAFDDWVAAAAKMAHLATFKVCDVLEQVATDEERQQGFDLADYLVRNAPPESGIKEYWSLTPVALPYFIAHPEDREVFHREFCREYRPVDFTEFEKYSLSIN